MILSNAFVQSAASGQYIETFAGTMMRVRQWPCDVSGAGRGVTIRYGVGWDRQAFPASPPAVSLNFHYLFTPYLAGGRMQGPGVLVDAWPGGSITFPCGNVTIDACVSGGWTSFNFNPALLWHWTAVAAMAPAQNPPTFTDWHFTVNPSTISANRRIPPGARSVQLQVHDATYSTGTWYEYAIDGSTRLNAQVLPGTSGSNTRGIEISGRGHYYRIGNTNTLYKDVNAVFVLAG